MFARDFWRTGRWHTLVPGDPGSDFTWVRQPDATNIGTTGATIGFELSQPCKAYLEWATNASDLGTANDLTNAPGETSFTYAAHSQSIGGLSPATTYHLRAVVEDADGNVLTSMLLTFTTTGDQPTPPGLATAGPRFDLYGAGASGDFPALGLRVWETDTAPWNGSAISWGASNVKIVPTSITSANALESWLLNTSNVPDGASSTDPTYVVFDHSHNGNSSTQYGAGTLYSWPEGIEVRSTRVFRNVVLWGYNAKLRFPTSNGNYCFKFSGGGLENFRILGFEIEGWMPDRTCGSDPSTDRACVSVVSYSGFKMMDCYNHNAAEMIRLDQWWIGNHYWDWPEHPGYSNDAEIAFNEGAQSGNQGILVNQGWNVNIHHNIIRDSRQSLFDQEDICDAPDGHPARRMVNLTIADNEFRRWAWQTPRDGDTLDGCAITFTDWRRDGSLDTRENIQILRNVFYDGPAGSGNPACEVSVLGTCVTCNASALSSRKRFCVRVPMHADDSITNKGITISGNVSYLPQWAVDQNGVAAVWGSIANYGTGPVIITDNNMQGMDFRVGNTPVTVTFTGNGDSTKVTV